MTGRLVTCDEQSWTLPVLLAWQTHHTDGTACDSFSVEFVWQSSHADALKKAVRFEGQYGGETVFTGVVDEYQVSLTEAGLTVLVTGRGLAALLLDNQTVAAEYVTVQLADILAAYVTPYGITEVDAGHLGSLSNFAVDSGETCWSALCGFCRHAADIQPRFLPDGTLVLQSSGTGSLTLSDELPILRAVWRVCRYGVYSQVDTVDRSSGAVTEATNDAFQSLGGQSRKVMTVSSGGSLRSSFRTGPQRVADSMAEWRLLEVTLPGAFLAWPGATVQADLAHLGLYGSGTVTEAVTELGTDGLTCTVTVRMDS
jgi:hypothetical protein